MWKTGSRVLFMGALGRLMAAAAVAALFAGSVSAEPQIAARVSATDVSLNDTITLAIEIIGISNLPSVPTPDIPGFTVQRAGQTQSYQWVNGQTSSMISLNYVLIPTNTGSFQIPPITLSHEGKNYTTQSISISVRSAPGGAKSPAQTPSLTDVPTEGLKPVFMTANVDKSKVYVGEQILLSVQFLRRPNVAFARQPQYSAPDLTGFLVEPLKQQEYTSTLHGLPYQVTELNSALFPTSDGQFAIGSAAVDVAVRTQADPFDPNGFFENFFGRAQTARLTTRAIPVQVRSLPKNKPADFSGAVGRYKLSARVDSTDIAVGQPFNLIVKIEGVGNINSLREPTLPEFRSFRRYDPVSSTTVDKDGKFLNGRKEFKYPMIPHVSGQITIPPISFTYFDPGAEEYVTTSSREIILTAKPGPVDPAGNQAPTDIATPAAPEGIRVVEKDIRFIKNGIPTPARTPAHRQIALYLANLFPVIGVLIALLVRWRVHIRSANESQFRAREAYGVSRSALKRARRRMRDPDPAGFYTELHGALTEFLANRWGLSASSLLWEDLERRFDEEGVDPDLQASVKELWEVADLARFATSSFEDESREENLRKAEDVLKRLNKVL